ncbi:hypothetical protein [Salininema proteolyticum]|uniref:DUF4440 domain-containing protein n=1 Tax=Salininema proteolyticum TaxID=1607685 RepID=A0ABV8U1D8_9ACTN
MAHSFDTVAREVVELHEDLAAWLGSEAEKEILDRFLDAQDSGFEMVSADGALVARADLASGLEGASNAQPGLEIGIDDVAIVADSDRSVVVRFRETHTTSAGSSTRVVTAVLVDSAGARNGLKWTYVHETAIPG